MFKKLLMALAVRLLRLVKLFHRQLFQVLADTGYRIIETVFRWYELWVMVKI